jgi:hypothetical protein
MMPEKDLKPVEQRIKSFAFSLRKDFGDEIRQDPSKFKACVIGTLKAVLPRELPGRKGSSEVKEAAELYLNLFASKHVPGNWHELAKRLVPKYASLSPEMERYHRLRSQTRSYLYDQRSRLRRSAKARPPSR